MVTTNKVAEMDWGMVWSGARERLRRELGEAVFDAWIAPLSFVNAANGEVKIGAVKPFARNWVSSHYSARIERALKAEGGQPSSLSIVLSEPKPMIGGGLAREPQAPPSAEIAYFRSPDANGEKQPEPVRNLWNRPLHAGQSFESFVCGPANEFAYRAARAAVENEDGDISILYLHGNFGNGKTHLLNAAALEARRRGRRALLLGAEDFMRQFLGAVGRRDTLTFKEELRAAEMLLIDDLQHICRSNSTISEFLHTVNAFTTMGHCLAIAADRPPQALEALGDDIRSRLSGGLVIPVEKPDRATRLAILESRAAETARQRPNAALPREVLERIADIENASPRDLIGIFTRLSTYADLTKKPVTLEVVEETVSHPAVAARKTSIEDIQRKTAEYYKLDIRDFHSPLRTRRVARPRQVAMYLSRELTMRSLPEIGRRFGGRDHTTVLHACRRVSALCQEDDKFRQEVEFLRSFLSPVG